MIEAAHVGASRSIDIGARLKAEHQLGQKIDGRSLRRTGRTHQVNVRLTESTKHAIQRIASARDLLIGEVIEQAVAALEAQLREMSEQTDK